MNHNGLDEEPLRKILRKFTYKPDWTFDIYEGTLRIRAFAPNTDNIESIVPVNLGVLLPRFTGPEFPWDRWLLDKIMEVERHEAQEFFKINGVKVFDPHA